MYLKQITLQGFKSFAAKTTLLFSSPDASGRLPLTAIVGPNGSGKSNIADAIRWVLGEQSIKAIRGKKSEDVIFTGSARRARASVSEVNLTVNNEDRRVPLDLPEVTVARRLYRDGQSEYIVNGKTTRLMDIQMLLAKAAFGKEGYSVIGQGQIDAILTASAEERKAFFDEATGVRALQIKKEQTLKKLAAVEENLRQAQLLQDEIAPRLRSLTRQVKRLEQREGVERELHELQDRYYGTLLAQRERELKKWRETIGRLEEKLTERVSELKAIERELGTLEKAETKPAELLKIQKAYESLIATKEKLREREFELKRALLESKKEAAAIPVRDIVATLEGVRGDLETIIKEGASPGRLETLFTTVSNLLTRLKGEKAPASAVSLTKELEGITKELSIIDNELEKLRAELGMLSKAAEEKKQSFFEVQRKLQTKQGEVHALEAELGSGKIELTKIETRREDLDEEARLEINARYDELKRAALGSGVSRETFAHPDPHTLLPEIQRLKRALETIGGIDEEAVKEHNEVKERHDFLAVQIADLEKSLAALITLLEELDATIKTQFEEAFEKINGEFGNYFRILFSGGHAKLTKIIMKEQEPEEANDPEVTEATQRTSVPFGSPGSPAASAQRPSLLDRFTTRDSYRGVEITATPPGKKLKSIAMLSGGERALTSIALLSAILALNPPPFVVLDEVDAALDESNSARFAAILTELAGRTQFIVITHNRATMHAAQILYGVTMGEDGVSKILSLKLEEAVKA